jgi:hypothetical protein
MELPASAYLYTLATLAITYGGFAALFMLFRHNLDRERAHYDAFVIRGVVQKGFVVAASAMLPPLLFYCGLSQPLTWRIACVVAGLLQALFLVTWIPRRHAVKNVPTSTGLVINLVAQLVTAAFLLIAASGAFFAAGPGPFLIGVTLILFLSAIAYQEALIFLLRDDSGK